ncbi:hypothetical protein [Marinobacterium sedimentorum]|uniref:hypothetical protein n=1 Tax=Marinobacterium sedimentorum TaxID=2927804 RepID=UPI0020C5EE96|nr:hypothetical protein [Marinobacterium sedimentorum]MCP8686982.1 hypothetical protein [Marinobacterium sedimentorum]
MRLSVAATVLQAAALLLSVDAWAGQPRGNLTLDMAAYPKQPLFDDQNDSRLHPSLSASIDWTARLSSNLRFDFSAKGRVSTQAQDRLFGDIRESLLRFRVADIDVKAGVVQENWSVLEAWNPVDIVNQRDLVEDFQGDAKLGQPGVTATTVYNDWVLSAFLLPYNRERRIAEGEDRLRNLPAPLQEAEFEDGQGRSSVALRGQYRLGDFDLALSYFNGHAREPIYRPIIGSEGLVGFDEVYESVSQTGAELLYVIGDSVLKGEVIYRSAASDDFAAAGMGSETTFNQLTNGFDSMTLYLEAYYDGRSDQAALAPFQRDIYIGARYNLNDVYDSLVDVRLTHDLEFHSSLVDIRASRRLGKQQTLELQLLAPLSVEKDRALQGYENDQYARLSWAWYF